jgi:hypothetical protein
MTNTFVPALATSKFYGKIRYGAAALTFSSTTAQVGSYVFSANGCFDPNITGGALAPAGFSNLMQLYEHYTVYRSRITVIFTNNSTTPTMVGIALKPDTGFYSDPNNMLELPYEQCVQLEGANVYGASKTINMTANLSKYFGENVLRTTSLYRGDAVSNPTEQAYFHCMAYGLKGGSAEVFMTVKIEYSAMFTEPRELPASLQDSILQQIVQHSQENKDSAQPDHIIVPESKSPKDAPVEELATATGLMSLFSRG